MTSSLFNDYQKYIHLSRYAKWIEEEKRRETWEESVDRYFDYFIKYIDSTDLPEENKKEIKKLLG